MLKKDFILIKINLATRKVKNITNIKKITKVVKKTQNIQYFIMD